MNMKFFSYDPEDGFELHKTKQEAMDRARECMAEHQDIAADEGLARSYSSSMLEKLSSLL